MRYFSLLSSREGTQGADVRPCLIRLRAELQADKKDKNFNKRKQVLKRVVRSCSCCIVEIRPLTTAAYRSRA